MTTADQKIVQYLNEAHATECALERVLQSQIAMAPRGRYRQALESHLGETEQHARRVSRRIEQLGGAGNPLQAGIGLLESALGQLLALGKAPLDLARGGSGEEKLLKNAKDAVASEALEIATYTALEKLALSVGDAATAELSRSIIGDEERMMNRVLDELPRLTEAVIGAEVEGEPSFGIFETGAADAARATGARITRGARKGTAKAKRAKSGSTRRRKQPWPGYDEQSVEEIRSRLDAGSDALARNVRTYERSHKKRSGVLEATERELAHAS